MNQKKLDYSVLMSVYYKDNPDYLIKAIESILNQTHKTNDFVVISDGPLTEQLDDILKRYSKDIELYRLPNNMGLGEALNYGLRFCKNELVGRMDSDDICRENRFELQTKEFIKDPDLDLISSAIEEFEHDPNHINAVKELPTDHEAIVEYSKKRSPINHPASMFKKSKVIEAGGYSEKFHLFEDYHLWIRMLSRGAKVKNLSNSLLYFRAPKDMYDRRGGFKYAIDMMRFKFWMYKSGWSNISDFILSAIPHFIVAILPNALRKKVYYKLRKSNE